MDLEWVDDQGMNIFHRIAKKQNPELFERLSRSPHLHADPQLLFDTLNTPIAGQGPETLPLVLACPSIDLATYML